jgi:hypothetical protein
MQTDVTKETVIVHTTSHWNKAQGELYLTKLRVIIVILIIMHTHDDAADDDENKDKKHK